MWGVPLILRFAEPNKKWLALSQVSPPGVEINIIGLPTSGREMRRRKARERREDTSAGGASLRTAIALFTTSSGSVLV
jgi:hypothetical protein